MKTLTINSIRSKNVSIVIEMIVTFHPNFILQRMQSPKLHFLIISQQLRKKDHQILPVVDLQGQKFNKIVSTVFQISILLRNSSKASKILKEEFLTEKWFMLKHYKLELDQEFILKRVAKATKITSQKSEIVFIMLIFLLRQN